MHPHQPILAALAIFLMFISLSSSAAIANKLPQKIFELDLTDQSISTQGGGLLLFKTKNDCILRFDLYGEMGQEKYAFKFNQKGLISTRHIGYKYPVHVYDMQTNSEVTVDFDQTYPANQNKAITEKFKLYKAKIPQKLIRQNCRS